MSTRSAVLSAVMLSTVVANIPVIDVSALRTLDIHDVNFCSHVEAAANQVFSASVNVGFFYISNHGVDDKLLQDLDEISKYFFALPVEQKKKIDMTLGGKAWRGFFAVGDEVTSGIPDQKEGIYFGTELASNDADNRPLHGINQWPEGELGARMKYTVLTYMHEMKTLGQLLMRTISCSLNVTDQSFTAQFDNPTELFRIFNYPPHDEKFGERSVGVGEHTDYGYLTLLKQDSNGGLQVKDTRTNTWMEAVPIPGTIVVNLGDALEHATRGLFKATPHRVQQRRDTVAHRLSMPYFFDPCFDCEMQHAVSEEFVQRVRAAEHTEPSSADSVVIQVDSSSAGDSTSTIASTVTTAGAAHTAGVVAPVAPAAEGEGGGGLYTRWDGADPTMFTGTYGKYLLRKVSRAFPALFAQQIKEEPK